MTRTSNLYIMICSKMLSSTTNCMKNKLAALLIISQTHEHNKLSNVICTALSEGVWVCVCVCVVLITFVLSTKQLPHFSPAEHTHSDLTHTFSPPSLCLSLSLPRCLISLLPVLLSDWCTCMRVCVCVCVCVCVTYRHFTDGVMSIWSACCLRCPSALLKTHQSC